MLADLARRTLGEVRTRLLLCGILTIGGLFCLSIPISRKLIASQVNRRERENLAENLAAFENYYAKAIKPEGNLSPDHLRHLMKGFLLSAFPEDDNFLISIVDTRFHSSSPVALPEQFQPGSALMRQWEQTSKPTSGIIETSDKHLGNIMFHAQPVVLRGKVRAILVSALTTGGEYQESVDLSQLLTVMFLGLLMIGLILTWILANIVLKPLSQLAATTRLIGSDNLSMRLPQEGNGELARISCSFNTMLDRLEGHINSQKEFLQDAGHELRTPLTILRGHVELLPQDRSDEERNQTIELLLNEIDRMSRLVDELSLLVSCERPEFLVVRTFRLDQFTSYVFHKAKGLAARQWQLSLCGTGMVRADPDRITQCLMNLLQNAVQNTNTDDIITIGSELEEGGSFSLSISDTGCGIAPELQTRIFDRFVRGPTAAGPPRSGLGLSIVR